MRRGRREGGVAVVEAAFVVPILFMFIMGLVDLGMWSYNANQATNAAKDGARAAIIDYHDADVPGSDAHDAIVETIEAHLPGRNIGPGDIIVTCVDEAGTAIGSCEDAEVDADRIRVDVTWDHHLITPIAGIIGRDEVQARGVATMAIVGAPMWGVPPTTTTTPTIPVPTVPATTTTTEPIPDCVISNLQVTDPVFIDQHRRLNHRIDIEFDTNGAARCEGLAVQLTTPPPGNTVVSAVCDECEGTVDQEWEFIGANGNAGKIWDIGPGTVHIYNSVDLDGDGTSETHVNETRTFQVKRG